MQTSASRKHFARFFTALSHHRRLRIFDLLMEANTKGIRFDALCNRTGMTPSTLSHHLSQMDKGGIIKRSNKGRETWFSVDVGQFQSVSRFT
jgi:ArsR family transcriptional regulator, arsenate/arsenite/antimonite-responsive transcriptional repressor